MPDPCPARIPHAEPLRFARSVVSGDGCWLVTAVVDPASPAASDGRVRPGYLIEVAAQAAAAIRGGDGGAIRGGRLVGCSGWRIEAAAAAGRPITARVRAATALGPLAAFEIELEQDGHPLAHGSLQVHTT